MVGGTKVTWGLAREIAAKGNGSLTVAEVVEYMREQSEYSAYSNAVKKLMDRADRRRSNQRNPSIMTVNGIECAFIGRLGGEPEPKTSQAGKPWTAISVAVGDGDEAQWVRVVAFGDKAEQIAGHFHKDDRVCCEGRIWLDTWTSKDGKDRAGLKVVAWRIDRLGEIGRNKPAKPRRRQRARILHHLQPARDYS